MSNLPQTRRSLSLKAVLDKNNLDSAEAILALVEIQVVNRFTGAVTGEVIRIANSPPSASTDAEDGNGFTFQGNYYQPAQFDIQVKEAAGEIPTVTLSVSDVTGIVRTYMDAYQGGVGFLVRLSVVWFSTLSLPAGEQRAEIDENFIVTDASVNNRDVSLGLGAPNLLSISFPRRRQTRDFCQWAYKGVQCKYVGPLAECDRTLQGPNGCATHNNTINFGGFPGIQGRDVSR